MKLSTWMWAAIAAVCFGRFVGAIEESMTCVTDVDPAKNTCTNNRMNIRFENGTAEINPVAVDQIIPVKVTIDVVDSGIAGFTSAIAGFTYGVKHDKTYLELVPDATDGTCDYDLGDFTGCNPTTVGTTKLIEAAALGGWDTTLPTADRDGFISAIVLSLKKKLELPVGPDYHVCNVKYKVLKNPGEAGTKVFFTDELSPPGSPATTVNLTINSQSKRPSKVDNGMVIGTGGTVEPCKLTKDFGFYFGPAATDAAYDIANAAEMKISLRNKGTKGLGFSFGFKKTDSNIAFDNTLGAPVIDLVFTKEDGNEVVGMAELAGNTAINAPTAGIASIEKGAVLPATGDFFGPTIDGTGAWATVGYVVDVSGSGKTIEATTDPVDACAQQEIMIVKFGAVAPNFKRGDANGDSKINVTDGVLVAQNIFASKLVKFDCKDMLDVNDDGRLDTGDPVYLLTYIFLKGPKPPTPFDACGPDSATAETPVLDCAQPNCQ